MARELSREVEAEGDRRVEEAPGDAEEYPDIYKEGETEG